MMKLTCIAFLAVAGYAQTLTFSCSVDTAANTMNCSPAGGGSGVSPYFGNIPTLTSPGALTNWTWVNQGSAAGMATNGGLYINSNAVSGTHSLKGLVISTPAPPYEYEAAVGMLNPATANWDALTGIVIQESSSGKLMTCQLENDGGLGSGQPPNFMFASATYWTSPTNPIQDQVIDYYRWLGWTSQPLIRYGDDGTNRYCKISMDGGNTWLKYVNQSRTANLTADRIGFFGDVWEGSATSAWAAMLMSWKRTI